MLQIASSASSLAFLSSKIFIGLCGGFFMGSKVVFTRLVLNLYIPKNSTTRTRTTTSTLLPTKCSHATPTASFSCIAIAGYVTIIVAAVFCVLHAKGFLRAASQSPPPPPEPSLNFSRAKKHGWMWLWWLLALLGIIALGLTISYVSFGGDESLPAFATPWFEGLTALERSFFHGLFAARAFFSAVRLHIITHGPQYAKIILLALASHSACILLVIAFERFLAILFWFMWLPFFEIHLIPIIVIGSTSKLNWIFWLSWYWESSYNPITVSQIQQRSHRLLAWFTLQGTGNTNSISMVVGPALVYAATMGLRTTIFAYLGTPRAARSIIRHLSRRPMLLVSLQTCAFALLFIICSFGFSFSALQYGVLAPATQQLIWKSFSCAKSRAELRGVYQLLLSELLKWKATQIKDLPDLVLTLRALLFEVAKLCARTWGALPWGHKLLIIVPALMFHSYFYLIPAARELKDWRRRRRHLQASFFLSTYVLGRESASVSIDGDNDDTTQKDSG
ncbi:hypothetical protein B0H15DRAFT_1024279 [Mycena belliarum]|uniref:Uncharacterized protein n=1 Tax=Mycena belliarum TaxID=1033014 RepID=A0AAD6U364_9AGAR|nr:hypothetical protein B0H15DRAFT_1024279 [Mycena belliae]